MSMTTQTFDVIWNGFGDKELLRLKKVIKQVRLLKRLEMLNGESRTTDTTTENRTTKSISKDITKRERNNRAYAIYAVLP